MPRPNTDLAPLRTRAEQIVDEIAAEKLADQAPIRQLPASPPVKPPAPGR
ncbi:MAG: hypothetical protein QOF68_2147 [Gaiellales bacterium]|jgi:hypothetical protein|nr:hypothetical protein [Gaiellales bacterium]